MADFLSVIESIRVGGDERSANLPSDADQNGSNKADTDNDIVVDEKELEEQVNDLVEIRKKDLLRKNLRNIVRENLMLKQKVKVLEARISSSIEESASASYNLLFRLDIDGDEVVDSEVALTEETAFILKDSTQEEQPPEEDEPKKSSGNKCFNCLGDHMIADCPLPKNPKEINKNKKEFQASQANFGSARYHIDENQKFGHIRPGLPSDKLRKALGLRDDQVPEYIYKMRAVGYPPGWLTSARINSSGISLYHNKGEKEPPADGVDREEEGEVEQEERLEYDVSKLVDWPGFNSSLPKEFRDETSKYRVPSLSRVKSLKVMIEELRPSTPEISRKRIEGSPSPLRSPNNETIVLDSTIELDSDLDESKKDISIQEEKGKTTNESIAEEKKSTGDNNVEAMETEDGNRVSTPPPRHQSIHTVAKTEPGTPICEVYSPFTKLPSQISWGKDMSEHVAFENLPEYTGKWEQMSGLIKTIRSRKKDKSKSCD